MAKTTRRGFSSPPCYQHELDPNYLGNEDPQDDEQLQQSSWANVRTWRVQTRSRLIALRENLPNEERKQCAEDIVSHLADAAILSAHRRVGFYWPVAGEIDLCPLMAKLADQGVQAALPVITASDQPLEFWAWNPGEELSDSGPWNIPVPITRRLIDATALLIPLVGFDKQGHRLGHGGGYYDRTLANSDARPVTVGVGLEACRLPSIYPQAHDVPMDVIVTDAGVQFRNKPGDYTGQ